MNLSTYVEALRDQMLASAEMADAASRELAERLIGGMGSAIRLMLLEAISAAADEITSELAPGAVEVRLRGGNPEFVLTLPPATEDGEPLTAPSGVNLSVDGEGETSRLNLRLPESLKGRLEEVAQREGLSLNAWLVRTAAAALEGHGHMTTTSIGSHRYTGWVR